MSTKPVLIDRRTFLGSAGLAAGAVVATSLVPLSVVHALPADHRGTSSPAPAGDWHVDDICGHWPPYAHPIGYGRPGGSSASLIAHADPIDHIFLA